MHQIFYQVHNPRPHPGPSRPLHIEMLPTRPSLPQAAAQPQGSKKLLYARLSQQWFLPPARSTGVSQTYLHKVDQGQVFRVDLLSIQRFLAECKPSQLKRVPFVNKDQAYAKVNRLLGERGQPDLGFAEGCWPDGEWLYRVARFVDPTNLSCLFVEALSEVTAANNDSTQVELGKRKIEEQLAQDLEWKDRPEVVEAIGELRMSQQRVSSRKAELHRLMLQGQKLQGQVEKDQMKVEMSLERAVRVVVEGVKKKVERLEEAEERQVMRELTTK